MKKILLSVFAGLLLASSAIAQGSIKLLDAWNNNITNIDVYTWGANNVDITYDAAVINISSSSKTYKVKRIETSVDTTSYNYFCWHLCYAPSTSVSPQGIAVSAGDTTHAFHGYYNAAGTNGEGVITYVFYDQNNTSDSAFVRVHYFSSPTGIQEAVTGENKLIPAFPNPAASATNISYTLKSNVQSARISMYNMLGEIVKEITLDEKQGTVKLNTDQMSPGIYFYSLVADNKVITTRKLVISR